MLSLLLNSLLTTGGSGFDSLAIEKKRNLRAEGRDRAVARTPSRMCVLVRQSNAYASVWVGFPGEEAGVARMYRSSNQVFTAVVGSMCCVDWRGQLAWARVLGLAGGVGVAVASASCVRPRLFGG